MLCAAGFAAVDSSFIALMKPLLDGSFMQRDPEVIRWIPLAILGLFLLRGVLGFASSYGIAWVSNRVAKDIRCIAFERLLALPTRYFEKTSLGKITATTVGNTSAMADAVTSVVTAVLKDGLTIIGLLCVMIWMSWKLALFVLAIGPVIALVTRYVSRRFRSIGSRMLESGARVTEVVNEATSSQRVVKVFNSQAGELRRFEREAEQSRWLTMKLVATTSTSSALVQFVAAWAVAAVVFVATLPEMVETITPGTFVAFIGALMALLGPMKALSSLQDRFMRGVVAAENVFRQMDEVPEPVGGDRPLSRARGTIQFEQLRFRYNDEQASEALRGIDLRIEQGQTVAFVGRSGSGKSTLLSLLPRFYDPTLGRILLDGHDLRDYRLKDLRGQMALVDQQVRLFSGTVAENIAYGMDPAPAESAIIEAAKSAYAWEFIEKLPQGLHTAVGQNGNELSGGQRQRIAIARALLRNTPILLLDEATSALDTESERYIQAALEKLVVGRTTLIIAHRLSTITHADLIVVMHNGQIIESGRHEELLAKNGAYAALHQMQFQEDHAQQPA